MALTWNQAISTGSSKVNEDPIHEIIDNMDVLYTSLELTPPSIVKPADQSPVNKSKMQEIMDAADNADTNNYCRAHNATYNSSVLGSNYAADDNSYYNPYNSNEHGSYDSGDNYSYDSSDNGTYRSTHYSGYDSGYNSGVNSGNDGSHDGTHKSPHDSSDNSGYNSGYDSNNNDSDYGTYYGSNYASAKGQFEW